MKFLHINPNNKEEIQTFNDYVKDGKDIFVLIYLEGCGPCNATRPEWKKIENILEHKYKNNNNVVVADIDQELLRDIKHLKTQPKGFPTMLYISNKGEINEDYEDSSIKNKDRTIDSFIEWIELKSLSKQKGGKKTFKKRVKKGKKTHKWSLKYKRSINCRKPKGFSQRQYCKYGRKK